MSVVTATPSAPAAPSDVQGRSLRQIAWSRFRKDKAAMVSMWILAFIFLVAIFASWGIKVMRKLPPEAYKSMPAPQK